VLRRWRRWSDEGTKTHQFHSLFDHQLSTSVGQAPMARMPISRLRGYNAGQHSICPSAASKGESAKHTRHSERIRP
jgi:hypothetical protein